MSETQDDELRAIPVDDPIRQGAVKVVEPPVDPQLELLPTNLMEWEDLERLLLDLGRHELGLRSLSFFGKRGQAQKGRDVVGVNCIIYVAITRAEQQCGRLGEGIAFEVSATD